MRVEWVGSLNQPAARTHGLMPQDRSECESFVICRSFVPSKSPVQGRARPGRAGYVWTEKEKNEARFSSRSPSLKLSHNNVEESTRDGPLSALLNYRK